VSTKLVDMVRGHRGCSLSLWEQRPGPGARAPSGRVVLRLKTAKRPTAPAAPLLGGRPGPACTPPDFAIFYTGEEKGFTDYPALR